MKFRTQIVLALHLFIAALAVGEDAAGVYQKMLGEINALEEQLAQAVGAKDFAGFVKHYEIPEAEAAKLKGWFEQITSGWADGEAPRIVVELPLLAATGDEALVYLGRLDVYQEDGERHRQGWPPLVLERRADGWKILAKELKALDRPAEAGIQRAVFDAAPCFETSGVKAKATFTVVNETDAAMERLAIFIRHPLEFEEILLDGRPMEAEVEFGEIEGKPTGLLLAKPAAPLGPGETAEVSFRYSASYDYHELGRKPVGFTGDRGFILWEAGWYPYFSSTWQMMAYEMTITVPRGYRGLTSGELLERREDGERVAFRYDEKLQGAPFLLWGRYKETSFDTDVMKITFWTPEVGGIDPEPLSKVVLEAIDAFAKLLPPPSLKEHRVAAVTRYGGYGANGNLLLHDPTFDPEGVSKPQVLDFVAHELSHSWVNSLSVPTIEPQSLLGEGLATYLGAKAVEKSRGREEAVQVWEGNLNKFINVAGRAIPPMELSEPLMMADNVLFRGTAYFKGAYLFRELESLVGEEVVFRGLRELMREHRGGEFSIHDFMRKMETLADRDLEPFWSVFLYEARTADYAIEPVGEEAGCARVRLRNRGRLTPTPVEVAAYDGEMRELERKRVVVDQAEGYTIEFQAGERVAKAVVDPDKRVVQSETRNDVYPDSYASVEDAAAATELADRLLRGMRNGDIAAIAELFADDEELLSKELRERMLSGINRTLPFAIEAEGEACVMRLEDGRILVKLPVKFRMGEAEMQRVAELTAGKQSTGWRLVMIRI